jgi:hypothetical protein
MILGVIVHYALWTRPLLPKVPARVLDLPLFGSAGVLAHLSHRAVQRVGTRPGAEASRRSPFRAQRSWQLEAAAWPNA